MRAMSALGLDTTPDAAVFAGYAAVTTTHTFREPLTDDQRDEIAAITQSAMKPGRAASVWHDETRGLHIVRVYDFTRTNERKD